MPADTSHVLSCRTLTDPLDFRFPRQSWPNTPSPTGGTVDEIIASVGRFPGMFTYNAVRCPITVPGRWDMIIPLARHVYTFVSGGLAGFSDDTKYWSEETANPEPFSSTQSREPPSFSGFKHTFFTTGFRLPLGNGTEISPAAGDFIQWAIENHFGGVWYSRAEVKPGLFRYEYWESYLVISPQVMPGPAPSLQVGFLPDPDAPSDFTPGEGIAHMTNGFWPGAKLALESGEHFDGTLAYHLELTFDPLLKEFVGQDVWTDILTEVPLFWEKNRPLDPLWVAMGNAKPPSGSVTDEAVAEERASKEPEPPGEKTEGGELADLTNEFIKAALWFAKVAATLKGSIPATGHFPTFKEEEEFGGGFNAPRAQNIEAIVKSVERRLRYGPFMNGVKDWAYRFSISKPPPALNLPDLTKTPGWLIVGFKAGAGGFFPVNSPNETPLGGLPSASAFFNRVELLGSATPPPPSSIMVAGQDQGLVRPDPREVVRYG